MSVNQQAMPQVNPAALLEDLRDIHLPADPSWWPLAPAWWVLLFIILLLCVLLFVFLKKRAQLKSKIARHQQYESRLNVLRQQFSQHQDKSQLLQECSMLLRQIAIAQDQSMANITGKQWLNSLDDLFDCKAFTNGVGRLFADTHYRARAEYDSDELMTLMKGCLNQLLDQQISGGQHA